MMDGTELGKHDTHLKDGEQGRTNKTLLNYVYKVLISNCVCVFV